MTYQEKLEELTNIWRQKVLTFYRINKEVLAMEGDNVPKIDRNSIEVVELEKAQLNIKNFQIMMEQNKINPLDNMQI